MNNPLRTMDDYEKRNRVPASEMSFTRPNLPTLIQEIEMVVAKIKGTAKSDKE